MKYIILLTIPLLSFIPASEKKNTKVASQVYFVVIPENNIVPSGAKFTAELFVAEVSPMGKSLTIDGSTIIQRDGVGRYEFTTRPGNYDENGLSKQSFSYTYKLKSSGIDTTVTFKHEYYVLKSIVDFDNNILVKNCANTFKVIVPSLGQKKLYKFKVDGGVLLDTKKENTKIIIPEFSQVKLTVINSVYNKTDQTIELKAVDVPNPRIFISINKRKLNSGSEFKVVELSQLTMEIVPDEFFKQSFPDDCIYNLKEVELSLVRKNQKMYSQIYSHSTINLDGIKSNAKSGDLLKIEVKKIERTTFRSTKEEQSVSDHCILLQLL